MKQALFKTFAGLLMASTMLMPTVSMAQSATSTTSLNAISALLQQIKALQDQINALKTQQAGLQTQASAQVTTFLSNLTPGSSGDDVKALQALLASDSNIYPEGLITGYFGNATKNAVKRFQKEHGLEQVGLVGPKTRALLNQLLGQNGVAFENDEDNTATSTGNHGDEDKGQGKHVCAIVPPGHLIAPGWLRKHGDDKPIVPPCQILPPGIINHGDDDHHGTTTPPVLDTVKPVISAIVSTPSSTGATIAWTTNESATTKVYYGTSAPFDLNASTTLSTGNATLVTSHTGVLTGLSALTTYYYVVESRDASGNTATSSVQSFATTAIPDTTAPIISGIGETLAATTTTVVWTTNESATSKVYFGTTTPLVLGSASTVSDTTLVTGHSLLLSGLATSTLYHFVIESKDASTNTATSSEMSFTTLAQ